MSNAEKLIVSISERPSNFGKNFHNQGYTSMGLNYRYIPLKVLEKELEGFIPVLRNNFTGCSVSMPHKVNVIPYLDSLSNEANNVGAVNTIVNTEGHLRGFNTDVYGVSKTLESLDLKGKISIVAGCGGVSRAVVLALRQKGSVVYIAGRNEEKARKLSDSLRALYLPWEDLSNSTADLFVNATPIGMNGEESFIPDDSITNFGAVLDVVVKETPLLRKANERGVRVFYGNHMTVHQATEQFRIYTGQELPQSFINKKLEELTNGR